MHIFPSLSWDSATEVYSTAPWTMHCTPTLSSGTHHEMSRIWTGCLERCAIHHSPKFKILILEWMVKQFTFIRAIRWSSFIMWHWRSCMLVAARLDQVDLGLGPDQLLGAGQQQHHRHHQQQQRTRTHRGWGPDWLEEGIVKIQLYITRWKLLQAGYYFKRNVIIQEGY